MRARGTSNRDCLRKCPARAQVFCTAPRDWRGSVLGAGTLLKGAVESMIFAYISLSCTNKSAREIRGILHNGGRTCCSFLVASVMLRNCSLAGCTWVVVSGTATEANSQFPLRCRINGSHPILLSRSHKPAPPSLHLSYLSPKTPFRTPHLPCQTSTSSQTPRRARPRYQTCFFTFSCAGDRDTGV